MTHRPLILLDALGARPPCTGVAWSMVELVQALAAAAPPCRFALATRHPDLFAAVADRPDWELIVLAPGGGRLGRLADATVRIPNLASRLGADLIHSMTIPVARGGGRPTVVTVHDIAFKLFPETVEAARRAWYHAILPVSLRSAAAVLVNSDNTRAEVAAHYPATVGKLHVTPFGTPEWARHRDPDPGTAERGDFLFVGALEPRKNLERSLDALDLFRHRLAEAGRTEVPRLRIIGAPGWRNSSLLKRLEAAETTGAVRLRGHCDRETLWQEYSAARALLFPSLHEGFGFPILEAMSARLPVITADRGAMREVAGEAALLVDPESPEDIAAAMHRIHDDPELCGRLAQAGARRCSKWTWETTAERTLESYFLLTGPR